MDENIAFPDANLADDEGLIAIGGDLSAERLIAAYKNGIFPWFNEGEDIWWWSPNPRFVLYPDQIKLSKTDVKFARKSTWTVTHNQKFREVIARCKGVVRPEQDGTWITNAMEAAYVRLHEMGIGMSIEVMDGEELVGGLYGLCMPPYFFGESMFSLKSNGSKMALKYLCEQAEELGVKLIDCQMKTAYLEQMGGVEVPRAEFLEGLKRSFS